MFDNESIESIVIKSRAEEEGYAKQNNLITGVWIDIYFGGDLPLTMTGKITNTMEDKIEITTFPENDVIFIDFAYKGLPDDLPIEETCDAMPSPRSLPGHATACWVWRLLHPALTSAECFRGVD